MDYLLNNHGNLLYVIGAISLVVELFILGMSGPLLFFALACISTGVLVSVGLLTTWEHEVLFVGILSIIIAATLWKPLKKLQGGSGPAPIDTSSDMIGLTVPISQKVNQSEGTIRYSGISWQARLSSESNEDSIDIGNNVKIIGVQGNVMIISTIDN